MKWEGRRQSNNVKDSRGKSSAGKTAIGGALLGIVITLLYVFGGDTGAKIAPVLEQVAQQTTQTTALTSTRELTEQEKQMGEMVAVMFADTEDVWHRVFQENGIVYKEPKMEIFENQVQTACGSASWQVGPFYCPADQTVYMDLGFFEELHTKYGAQRGNMAIAYVIAHEVGHHVQYLLGTNEKVRKLQANSSKVRANELSVAQELQADFYAGLWAGYIQKYLEPKDITIALSAASAVGDDAIQQRHSGQINPESFTHGTSEQRQQWFLKGYNTKDIKQGNTFELLN
ncbi:KPN_02809 family neutral zinc metallopeptidase [Myroides sp. LJL116]